MLLETRWPVIIFSRITVFGESFDVFPRREMPRDPLPYIDKRDASVDTVFLLPSTDADIFAESVRAEVTRGSDASLSYATALFLLRVRGVPLGELTVKTPRGFYDVKSVKNDGKYGVLMSKCKQLYTKSANFADKTDVKVHTASLDSALYNIVECADSDMFSEEILHSLLLSRDGERISAAAAVSAAAL